LNAGQVHPHVPLPQLGILLHQLRQVVERARVADEDVDRAELAADSPDGGLDLAPHAHVATKRQGAAPERLDLRGRAVRGSDVGDRDVRARRAQSQRVRPAEAARRSGNERDPPGEVDLDQVSRGMKISRAITSRWICEVPS
jgi:hypothetical protein